MRKALLSWCVVVAAASTAPGCAGAAMGSVSADVSAESRYQVFGDIERLQFSKQVQVALPAKAAIADVTRDDRQHQRLVTTITALAEDRATWTDVNSVFALGTEANAAAMRFEDLRAAASRQQSDLLLVVRRTERVHASNNALCIFNLLIVPMLFLPTRDVRTTFDVHAAVIDVRNGLVYTTHDDQSVEQFSASVAGSSGATRDALDGSWDRIVARMKTRIGDKLRTVAGTR